MNGNVFTNNVRRDKTVKPLRELRSQDASENPETGTAADDYYKVVPVSYDVNLIDKGISSSSPVVIGTVPLVKQVQTDNASSEIINIQRNLNTITISNVNEIINDVTSSVLTTQELESLDDPTQVNEFKTAVSRITAAYNAKAAYMTYIGDIFSLETDNDFNNGYGTGTFPQRIQTVAITERESKQQWAESELKITQTKYNFTQMMQILRNSFARKKYGSSYTLGNSSQDPLEVTSISPLTYELAKLTVFSNLYGESEVSQPDDIDDQIDILLIADSKDISYTQKGVDPQLVFETLIGNLSEFPSTIKLSKLTGVGPASGFLRFEDESRSVLPFETAITSQSSLQQFIAADEYFLGQPLVTNKELLKTRSAQFASIAQEFENSYNTNLGSLVQTASTSPVGQDLSTWSIFLAQMKTMMDESFFTTNNFDSMLRFAALLTALKVSKRKVFKIMMLRDRLRNYDDYVDNSQQQAFIAATKRELRSAIFDFFKDLGTTVTNVRENEYGTFVGYSNDDSIALFDKLGKTFDNVGSEEFLYDDDPGAGQFYDSLFESLESSSSQMWDNFFTAAGNVEKLSNNFTREGSWAQGFSVLTVRPGTSTGFLKNNRDKRAYLFFNKWISIISNFPFTFSVTELKKREGSGDEGSTNYKVKVRYRYTPRLYQDLKQSLTLTLESGMTSLDVFNYFSRYSFPVTQKILQDTQVFYDGVDLVYRSIMQASTLLADAASKAYNYTPVFGENLVNNYTRNSVLNLNRQARFAFAQNPSYKNFSKDQYPLTDTLNGFLRYVQEDPQVSTAQDSFVLLCGIPYGTLDRLGAFNQNKIGYMNVRTTFRTLNADSSRDVVIDKIYPINSYIEPLLLAYNPTTNASDSQVLAATQLYEIDKNRNFVPILEFSEESKKNELQSVSLLSYIQMYLGIRVDPYLTTQVVLDNITTPEVEQSKIKLTDEVRSYRFSELIETRYVSSAVNSLRFNKSNLITRALGGCIFDKVVAIPVDASLLKVENPGFLVDIIIDISTDFVDRVSPVGGETTRSVRNFSDPLITRVERTNVQSAVRAAQNIPNVFGVS
jgi:hypothetical protein